MKKIVLGAEKKLDEFWDSYFANDIDKENSCSKSIYRHTKATINWHFLAIIKTC